MRINYLINIFDDYYDGDIYNHHHTYSKIVTVLDQNPLSYKIEKNNTRSPSVYGIVSRNRKVLKEIRKRGKKGITGWKQLTKGLPLRLVRKVSRNKADDLVSLLHYSTYSATRYFQDGVLKHRHPFICVSGFNANTMEVINEYVGAKTVDKEIAMAEVCDERLMEHALTVYQMFGVYPLTEFSIIWLPTPVKPVKASDIEFRLYLDEFCYNCEVSFD